MEKALIKCTTLLLMCLHCYQSDISGPTRLALLRQCNSEGFSRRAASCTLYSAPTVSGPRLAEKERLSSV